MSLRCTARGLWSAPLTLAVIVGLSVWAAAASGALLPPHNPAHSLTTDEHAQPDCQGVRDDSPTCLDESLAMLDAGRRSESLGPLVLPRNWTRLTIPEQIFVITQLERTARGLQPDTGLATDWDAGAQAGADVGADPTRAGAGAHGYLSIWAGGQPNPIAAMVGWIYDDGYFPDHTTQNIACSRASPSGCWGHRDAILHDSAATACGHRCAVGAGYSSDGFSASEPGTGHESYAEVFGVEGANNPDPLRFRWAAELPQLPVCERVDDSCSWTGRPLLTAGGVVNVRGLRPGSSLVRPWFNVSIRWTSSSEGGVSVAIATGLNLGSVTVTAAQGAKRVPLSVSKRGAGQFAAAGQLTSGQWKLTIDYDTPAIDGPRPASTALVRVP